MDIKGNKFLVIGGAGFIGSHVVDQLLEQGAQVTIYDNFCRGKYLPDAALDWGLVRDDILHQDVLEDAMDGMHGVFHLAALWLLHCERYRQAAFDVNVRGTFNVIEACRKLNIKRLVFSSSASVYGNAVEEPMSENHPYNNQTFYGATKIAGEHMFKSSGVPGVCLRYMNVYGPRQDTQGAYVAVIPKMLSGETFTVTGDGEQAYDFVYVEDVAKANILAMQSSTQGFYNVGTGIKTSINRLISMIGNKTVSYEGKTQFVTSRVGGTTKAEKELGFKAETSLEEGLRRMIDEPAKAL